MATPMANHAHSSVHVVEPDRYLEPDTSGAYKLSQLGELEAQSIYIMREVGAESERPALLFSGGKDSIVMLHLARKAFFPAPPPFPVLHIDTGRNFPEVLEFRIARSRDSIRLSSVVCKATSTRERLSTKWAFERLATGCRPRRC